MRAGLVLDTPPGTFPGAGPDGVVFVGANEARCVAIPSVKRRLGAACGLDVGIAVIDGRVVGYIDVAAGSRADEACVLASVEGKGELALAGVRVLEAGRFPEAADGRSVTWSRGDVPIVEIALLAARVEASGGKAP